MATYNQGQVGFGDPGAVIDSTVHSRRLYDFSDRIADLAPEESPFFVYLSKVGKVPTSDPQFRFLEDRNKIQAMDRGFSLDAAVTVPAAGSSTTYTVDDGNGNAVGWLIKGMVFYVGDTTDSTKQPEGATVRIESAPVIGSTETTFTGKTIVQASDTSVGGADGTADGADGDKCIVIGTAFAEGTGAPDVWSRELENDYGYTQIFKTACEMTNTARATEYRGYRDEWQRIWNLKLREHKVDIERAMLFGMRGSQGGINYTEGIAGHIIYNGNAGGSVQTTGATQLSYNEGLPYMKTFADSEVTYDVLLSDLEVVFDPARGGTSSKLALASLPVLSYFNKLAGSSFIANTTDAGVPYNFERSTGTFGHKVQKIDTIHGDLTLVREPLFRGAAAGFMCMVDLDHVSYRPLVGNGVNRDTSITTNVQQADEDLRKDLILTEAGLEVSLPETHALFNWEDRYTDGS
tara:strand:+ start:135 stop:1520 length:1386 start_codon:yes stop_codon:yes gene_type:complete